MPSNYIGGLKSFQNLIADGLHAEKEPSVDEPKTNVLDEGPFRKD
jgi:hypothetical protein